MIDVMANQNLNEVIKTVDMNSTVLIMGKAATNRAINKIAYYTTVDAVVEAYGDSELTEAFKIAKSFRVPHIFLINVKNAYDYIEIANVLRHYDFAYVVPTNLYLGDAFFDSTRNNKKVGYYHHFLDRLSPYNRSTFIVTENHASLYEDIDAYLDEMKEILTQFKNGMTASMNGKNLCFVSNNLENYPFANVVLASILCVTDLGLYPITGNLGPVLFDIDAPDIGEHEMAYFKDSYLTGVTVENLLNLSHKVEIEKIIMIDRISKYVRRNLDLSRFKGRHMTAYQKLRIEKALMEYLDPMVNWILRSYQIKNIQFIKDSPGAGLVICDIDIWPVNSTEKFSIVVEG